VTTPLSAWSVGVTTAAPTAIDVVAIPAFTKLFAIGLLHNFSAFTIVNADDHGLRHQSSPNVTDPARCCCLVDPRW